VRTVSGHVVAPPSGGGPPSDSGGTGRWQRWQWRGRAVAATTWAGESGGVCGAGMRGVVELLGTRTGTTFG
jgi:hypothetical protein